MTVRNQLMEVRFAPAKRVQTDQHVIADRHIHAAQLKRVDREGLTVECRGNEVCNAVYLAAVTRLSQAQ